MGSPFTASEPSNDGGVEVAIHHAPSIALDERQVKFNASPLRSRGATRRRGPRYPRRRYADDTLLVAHIPCQRDYASVTVGRGTLVAAASMTPC